MSILNLISEQKILSAMRKGDYENLAGAGKPIQWIDTSLVPEEKRLAFDLLQKNSYTLPWIEKKNKLHKRITAYRQALREWQMEQPDPSQPGQLPPSFKERLQEINRRIFDYNNSVPVETLQVSFIDANRELAAILDQFPETDPTG